MHFNLTATLDQSLTATQPLDNSRAFYRLLSIEPGGLAELGSGGARVFGYGEAFAQELQRIGQISPVRAHRRPRAAGVDAELSGTGTVTALEGIEAQVD